MRSSEEIIQELIETNFGGVYSNASEAQKARLRSYVKKLTPEKDCITYSTTMQNALGLPETPADWYKSIRPFIVEIKEAKKRESLVMFLLSFNRE